MCWGKWEKAGRQGLGAGSLLGPSGLAAGHLNHEPSLWSQDWGLLVLTSPLWVVCHPQPNLNNRKVRPAPAFDLAQVKCFPKPDARKWGNRPLQQNYCGGKGENECNCKARDTSPSWSTMPGSLPCMETTR